ncbi:hypothetical protein C0Q70_04047 [Pomacea canaliculata]|uniref:Uncharacterized protein n=1 Tax=Pomacea canaliculata TaxID=400727 RepID=A0A2T7PUE6_POMCA|nr:hypothetical protein C0Q70_04047 [Pomacea canaliculata]
MNNDSDSPAARLPLLVVAGRERERWTEQMAENAGYPVCSGLGVNTTGVLSRSWKVFLRLSHKLTVACEGS